MITIWKAPLLMMNTEFAAGYHAKWKEEYIVEMPLESELLTVQVQKGNPCVWFRVDTEQKQMSLWKFIIVGTGHEIKIPITFTKYVGTFQLYDGAFIGHVFEVTY